MLMPLPRDDPGRGFPFGAEPRDSCWAGGVGAVPEITWLYVGGRPWWRASASLPELRAGSVSAPRLLSGSASFRCREGKEHEQPSRGDNRGQVDQRSRSSLAHIGMSDRPWLGCRHVGNADAMCSKKSVRAAVKMPGREGKMAGDARQRAGSGLFDGLN